ncbi:CCR4-NOT transcription complex subunit 11 [Chanodichthys erythropterus]|uniref:CCR4-NOT transcription complex subunit 11 n=1 Tax=Chanodichthys erythropterus TaxID=933992 RepID=UPI00351DE27C
MAVRRMNELWKTMALALMFGFLLLHSCQGQTTTSSTNTSPSTEPATGVSTISGINPNTHSPTFSTTEIPAQGTLEPRILDTTDHIAPSETPASDNSKDASQTDLPIQTETTASNDLVDNAVQETVNPNNPASNQESIKNKMDDIEEENANSGSSPVVFVSVLVTGLLLAATIVGIYYFKCHRRSNGKGMKLAEESYMADEENQGNTLVSVAPLNQPEPQEKPSLNGESQEAVKPQTPPAATNGHSTTKTADTEL